MADYEELAQKLDDLVGDDIKGNEQVKSLLTSAKNSFKVVTIHDFELKIRPTLSRKMRREIEEIQKKGTTDVAESENDMYRLISEMCLEDPFNKPETWMYIDEETGIATEAIVKIYEEALNTEKQIKKFR